MQIEQVAITTSSVDTAVAFFSDALELPTADDGNSARVRIGPSTLLLSPGSRGAGVHHLAFTIAGDRFSVAKRWLAERVPVLTRDGADEFALPEPWSSTSVYFSGPDGVLLELIARHSRPASGHIGVFTSAELLCNSEVGLAVDDVGATVDTLCDTFGIPVFSAGGPDFVAVGDHEGLLIVVHDHRIWFPTTTATPSDQPLSVRLTATATTGSAQVGHATATAG